MRGQARIVQWGHRRLLLLQLASQETAPLWLVPLAHLSEIVSVIVSIDAIKSYDQDSLVFKKCVIGLIVSEGLSPWWQSEGMAEGLLSSWCNVRAGWPVLPPLPPPPAPLARNQEWNYFSMWFHTKIKSIYTSLPTTQHRHGIADFRTVPLTTDWAFRCQSIKTTPPPTPYMPTG